MCSDPYDLIDLKQNDTHLCYALQFPLDNKDTVLVPTMQKDGCNIRNHEQEERTSFTCVFNSICTYFTPVQWNKLVEMFPHAD